MKWITTVLSAGFLLTLPPTGTADELTAQGIVDQMIDANNLSFERGKMDMKMVIQNKRGESRERSIRAFGKKENGLGKTRIEFIEPADVRGTTLLLLEQAGDEDDLQYLYLPAFKKTRRIAGSQKNGSFMGSDFTYADMESRDAQEGTKTRGTNETVGGQETFRISVQSTDAESDYSKVELWIHTTLFLPLKTEFYDRKGALLKVMQAKKIEKKNGEFVITHLRLKNIQKGSQTDLFVNTIDQSATFSDAVFDRSTLGK